MKVWAKRSLGEKKKTERKNMRKVPLQRRQVYEKHLAPILFRGVTLQHSRHVGEEAVLVVEAPFTIGAGTLATLACRLIR